MKKNTVVTALNELPKDFDLDQLIEKLIVIEKIDAGISQAKEGKTVSHENVKKMLKKWQK